MTQTCWLGTGRRAGSAEHGVTGLRGAALRLSEYLHGHRIGPTSNLGRRVAQGYCRGFERDTLGLIDVHRSTAIGFGGDIPRRPQFAASISLRAGFGIDGLVDSPVLPRSPTTMVAIWSRSSPRRLSMLAISCSSVRARSELPTALRVRKDGREVAAGIESRARLRCGADHRRRTGR